MVRARMRQLMMDGLPRDREVGLALCDTGGGALVPGPMATGHLMGVSIPLECPPGTDLAWTWHTHPRGVAEPSQADWEMTRRHGLKGLCITVPETGETRCWRAR